MVKSVVRPTKSPRSDGCRRTLRAALVEPIVTGYFDAPFGRLRIVASASGIRSISICNLPTVTGTANLHGTIDAQSHIQQAQLQLREYFDRQRTVFSLTLDARGTEFQTLAWSALCRIPYGSTSSYSQQAASMGKPAAVRAVGGANSRNPIFLVVPCHRVIGADGSLTGAQAAARTAASCFNLTVHPGFTVTHMAPDRPGFTCGIDVKRWLLEFERTTRLNGTGAVA